MTTGGRLPPLGQFWLVELVPGLTGLQIKAVRDWVMLSPTVVAMTDMAAISMETVQMIVLPPEQSWRTIPKKRTR
jgi:hypothetical protein